MKKTIFALLLLVSINVFAQEKIKNGKWIKLFNGKNLDGWVPKIKGHPVNDNFGNTFRVQDGAITVSYDQYGDQFKEQYGHLFYKKPFSAYLLVVEYRFTGEQIKDGPGWAFRNSGAMLHGQSPETMEIDQDFPISIEAQFLGGNGKDERSTLNLCTPGTNVVMEGKLFTPHCVNSTSKTFHGDQWVTVQLLVLGDSLIKHIVGTDTVLVYGKPQYDGKDQWVKQAGFQDGATIKKGTISLQSESHPVQFRKVELFDLEQFMDDPIKLQRVLAQLSQRAL